jgi:hypothetical protein
MPRPPDFPSLPVPCIGDNQEQAGFIMNSQRSATAADAYHSRYCDDVLECLARGHTLAAFAGEAGIPRETLLAWAKAHSDFGKALKIGQARAVGFWERTLADIACTGKGNATAATFALKICSAEENSPMAGIEGTHTGVAYTWSDLELARRVSHILMLAERHERGESNDPALS